MTNNVECVIIQVVEIHRFTVEFYSSFVNGWTVKIDGCLLSRIGGIEANVWPLTGNISRKELIHITLSEIAAVCTILGFSFKILKDTIAYIKKK